jgi:hypothetical protein
MKRNKEFKQHDVTLACLCGLRRYKKEMLIYMLALPLFCRFHGLVSYTAAAKTRGNHGPVENV